MELDWNDIDTVLLDMDGTLLDRHFDDHFWLEHVPKRYSARHNIPLREAKEQLFRLFRSQENTLNWTDLDYWTERLGLDIPLLKREIDHLIAVHPFVVEFLLFLKRHAQAPTNEPPPHVGRAWRRSSTPWLQQGHLRIPKKAIPWLWLRCACPS